MPDTLPSPTEQMDLCVRLFMSADSYDIRHTAVIAMSEIPGKEDIELTLPPTTIIRYVARMHKFGFQHGLRSPDCHCMEG